MRVKIKKEKWRPVVGYEGLYEVSSRGRVRILNYYNTGKSKILKCSNSDKGYLMVGLRKNGTSKTRSVHRLVAEAFIPNPNNFPIVNHKDETRTNNNVDNLEWCTPKYNSNYGTLPERLSKIMKGKKRNVNKV